jgi:OmpA-OmpF porin, OOP family
MLLLPLQSSRQDRKEPDMSTRRFLSPLTCLALAGALLPMAAPAQSWYAGGSAGQSSIRASSGDIDSGFLLDDGFTASGTTLDKTSTGWKAFVGYRLNDYFAVETGYADLGKASFNTTIVGAPAGTTPTPPFPIHASAKARGVFLSALAHWPVSQQLSIFGKVGAFRSRAEFTEDIPSAGITRVSRTERRTDGDYGVGLQWNFSRAVAVRLEWERFMKVGRGIGGREGRDVDFASVGVMVQF